MNLSPTRRTVLATGAASAAGIAGLSVRSAAAAAAEGVFAHGVASGDPRPDSVVLWTRVTPTPASTPGSGRGPVVTVRWEVARDAGFDRVVSRGSAVTGPSHDHTVKVDAGGLEPGTWFYYRFLLEGADGRPGPVSRTGRTRTAPADGTSPDRLRVGVVSCSNWQAGYFAAYRHLARRDDLDAVLHLGDYLYEGGADPDGVRQHVPRHEMVSLGDYRQRHAQYKSDPDLQDLHAALPWITTWDDHEVTNDNWRTGAENHQPDEGSFRKRRARAHRAYDEWMPVRMDGTADLGDGTRLFRRLRWGTLAEFTMLDLRTYRDEMVTTPVPFPAPQVENESDAPDRTLTGRKQMAWLKKSLRRSEAQWKLVGNSVMIAPLSLAQLPEETVKVIQEVTGEGSRDGFTVNTDQWDGYTADRHELLSHLTKHEISDAVFLTGDIHSGWACELPQDSGTYPVSGTAGVEFVCTSVTSSNIDDITGAPPRTATLAVEATIMANNRHIKYVDFDSHGYSVLDVTPERAQMDWWVLADRTQRGTEASWSRSWATYAGTGTVTEVAQPTG